MAFLTYATYDFGAGAADASAVKVDVVPLLGGGVSGAALVGSF